MKHFHRNGDLEFVNTKTSFRMINNWKWNEKSFKPRIKGTIVKQLIKTTTSFFHNTWMIESMKGGRRCIWKGG